MATFPAVKLGLACELQLAGTWTDITGYCLQEGTPLTGYRVTRGRVNETAAASPSELTVKLNNTDGRFSPRNPTGSYYPSLTRNTPVRVSVPDSGVYLRLADDTTSSATTPDSASLQITGSIDIRIDLALDNWTPSVLCAKWAGTTTLRAWALVLNADGSVTLIWWDGSVVQQRSTSGLAVIPLGRSMIRATLSTVTGTVQFWTAATMAGSQTLLATITSPFTTSVGAAATQPVSVGDNAAIDASFGTHGCQGKIYEFQLLNGIGGTLVADPVFTAQTPGAASFADAQSNTWTLNGTAVLSNRSYRFHGEMSSLPQNWDVTGHDVTTPVTAGGVLRRLQQGSAPVRSVMRRGIPAWQSVKSSSMTSLSSLPSTIAYWPGEDNAGATQVASGFAQNTDGIVVPAMMVAGTAAFQGSAGSPAADGVFACSAALAQIGSSTWTGRVPPYSANGTATQVTFLLSIPSGGLSGTATLILLTYISGSSALTVQYTTAAGGTLLWTAGISTLAGSVTGVNGNGYMIQLGNVTTGTPAEFLHVLQTGRGQPVTSFSSTTSAPTTQISSVVVNPFSANCGAAEIGHIWVQAAFSSAGTQQALPALSDTRIANLLNAYSGEAAGTRFARLCAENGFASRVYGYPAVTQAMGAQAVDTLANLLQQAEDADRGQIYEPRSALGLGYRTYASLTNQGAAFTLDFSSSADEISPPLTPVDDDQLIRNDVTVTRNSGSVYEAQVTTGPLSVNPPPAGAGPYQTALTAFAAYDSQAAQIASWMAWVGTADRERFPQVTIDLASNDVAMQALLPSVRDADIGSFLALVNPPGAWLPPDQISLLYWGITEQLGDLAWTMTLNAVPEFPYEVAAAGTARADTAGSLLAANATSSATTLAVATTTGNVWTTNGPDFPFFIRIAGERIQVTAIAGVTGSATSPAAFTTLASLAMGAGTWVIRWSVTLSGTIGAPELNNFQISLGVTYQANSVNAAAAGTYQQSTTVTIPPGGGTINLQSSSNAATTGAVYRATFVSPQSFTVARSQNGVTKAQLTGAAVNIDPQGIAALAGAF